MIEDYLLKKEELDSYFPIIEKVQT